MALIMTVEPGFGGQSLIPETLDKVSKLRRYASERGVDLDIEVDGGINADNVGLLTSSGANVIVAGSAIFKSKKPRAVINAMKDAAVKNQFKG
jgi:ribulose-phosphate 3-epimerase